MKETPSQEGIDFISQRQNRKKKKVTGSFAVVKDVGLCMQVLINP